VELQRAERDRHQYCTEHPTEKIILYCSDVGCGQLLCSECVASKSHRNLIHIKEYIELQKEKLIGFQEIVEEKVKEIGLKKISEERKQEQYIENKKTSN